MNGTQRNADTFTARTFWSAWPNNHMPADDFKLKREASAYCARNGGGVIRKIEMLGQHRSTRMDCIEVPPPHEQRTKHPRSDDRC